MAKNDPPSSNDFSLLAHELNRFEMKKAKNRTVKWKLEKWVMKLNSQ